ncbi:MAG: LysR family transcriptional regulator [Pseudomonadota bacterium]
MPEASSRLTLWGVEVFLATAEEGAVSAAARRLGASPSAVSQQLTALETAIGVKLVDRTQRPVQLTAEGEMFRRRAQIILREARDAQAELRSPDLAQLTTLRLGMIEDFDADVTPRLLLDMAAELKRCQFLLETGASHRLFDLLETRALDAIVAADLGLSADGLEMHPLLEEPFVLAAPHGVFKATPPKREDLLKLPFIQYTGRHVMGRVIAGYMARHNIRLPRRFELDTYHAIMAMVAGGTGWTILTPLGLMRAHRFRDQADIFPLPFPTSLSRTITLTARAGDAHGLPQEIASRLRPLLQELIVTPTVERLPWLEGKLRVI